MSTTYLISILLDGTPIFNGYFVVNNMVNPNITGFYENNNPVNILAPVGSFGLNDNLFISLNQPFSSQGVNIKTMSYYSSNPSPYGSNNVPPPNGDSTYNFYDFINNQGNIANFSENTYDYIITLPPIPSSLPADNNCQKSRFCYNYKPPGVIESCCAPVVCASNAYLSSLQMIPNVINNSSRTNESSLLQAMQQQKFQINQANQQQRTLQATLTNTTSIIEQLTNQLATMRDQRYVPYKPYIYPEIPQSVIDLQMRTANTGVPVPVFTMADCKGSQFVTTNSEISVNYAEIAQGRAEVARRQAEVSRIEGEIETATNLLRVLESEVERFNSANGIVKGALQLKTDLSYTVPPAPEIPIVNGSNKDAVIQSVDAYHTWESIMSNHEQITDNYNAAKKIADDAIREVSKEDSVIGLLNDQLTVANNNNIPRVNAVNNIEIEIDNANDELDELESEVDRFNGVYGVVATALELKDNSILAVPDVSPILVAPGYTEANVIQFVDIYKSWLSINQAKFTARDDAIQAYDNAIIAYDAVAEAAANKRQELVELNASLEQYNASLEQYNAAADAKDELDRITSEINVATNELIVLDAQVQSTSAAAAIARRLVYTLSDALPPAPFVPIPIGKTAVEVVKSVDDWQTWKTTYATAIANRDAAIASWIAAKAGAKTASDAANNKRALIQPFIEPEATAKSNFVPYLSDANTIVAAALASTEVVRITDLKSDAMTTLASVYAPIDPTGTTNTYAAYKTTETELLRLQKERDDAPPDSYKMIPSNSSGEYITIDYLTPSLISSFTTNTVSGGWSTAGDVTFIGSMDGTTWNLIGSHRFNFDQTTASFPAATVRYFRIIINTVRTYGSALPAIAFIDSLIGLAPSQISFSSGLQATLFRNASTTQVTTSTITTAVSVRAINSDIYSGGDAYLVYGGIVSAPYLYPVWVGDIAIAAYNAYNTTTYAPAKTLYDSAITAYNTQSAIVSGYVSQLISPTAIYRVYLSNQTDTWLTASLPFATAYPTTYTNLQIASSGLSIVEATENQTAAAAETARQTWLNLSSLVPTEPVIINVPPITDAVEASVLAHQTWATTYTTDIAMRDNAIASYNAVAITAETINELATMNADLLDTKSTYRAYLAIKTDASMNSSLTIAAEVIRLTDLNVPTSDSSLQTAQNDYSDYLADRTALTIRDTIAAGADVAQKTILNIATNNTLIASQRASTIASENAANALALRDNLNAAMPTATPEQLAERNSAIAAYAAAANAANTASAAAIAKRAIVQPYIAPEVNTKAAFVGYLSDATTIVPAAAASVEVDRLTKLKSTATTTLAPLYPPINPAPEAAPNTYSAFKIAETELDRLKKAADTAATTPITTGVGTAYSPGEYFTINYGTLTSVSSFTSSTFATDTSTTLGGTTFLGSTDGLTWNLLGSYTFTPRTAGLKTASFPAATIQYLRVVINTTRMYGKGATVISLNAPLAGLLVSQISFSSGLNPFIYNGVSTTTLATTDTLPILNVSIRPLNAGIYTTVSGLGPYNGSVSAPYTSVVTTGGDTGQLAAYNTYNTNTFLPAKTSYDNAVIAYNNQNAIVNQYNNNLITPTSIYRPYLLDQTDASLNASLPFATAYNTAYINLQTVIVGLPALEASETQTAAAVEPARLLKNEKVIAIPDFPANLINDITAYIPSVSTAYAAAAATSQTKLSDVSSKSSANTTAAGNLSSATATYNGLLAATSAISSNYALAINAGAQVARLTALQASNNDIISDLVREEALAISATSAALTLKNSLYAIPSESTVPLSTASNADVDAYDTWRVYRFAIINRNNVNDNYDAALRASTAATAALADARAALSSVNADLSTAQENYNNYIATVRSVSPTVADIIAYGLDAARFAAQSKEIDVSALPSLDAAASAASAALTLKTTSSSAVPASVPQILTTSSMPWGGEYFTLDYDTPRLHTSFSIGTINNGNFNSIADTAIYGSNDNIVWTFIIQSRFIDALGSIIMYPSAVTFRYIRAVAKSIYINDTYTDKTNKLIFDQGNTIYTTGLPLSKVSVSSGLQFDSSNPNLFTYRFFGTSYPQNTIGYLPYIGYQTYDITNSHVAWSVTSYNRYQITLGASNTNSAAYDILNAYATTVAAPTPTAGSATKRLARDEFTRRSWSAFATYSSNLASIMNSMNATAISKARILIDIITRKSGIDRLVQTADTSLQEMIRLSALVPTEPIIITVPEVDTELLASVEAHNTWATTNADAITAHNNAIANYATALAAAEASVIAGHDTIEKVYIVTRQRHAFINAVPPEPAIIVRLSIEALKSAVANYHIWMATNSAAVAAISREATNLASADISSQEAVEAASSKRFTLSMLTLSLSPAKRLYDSFSIFDDIDVSVEIARITSEINDATVILYGDGILPGLELEESRLNSLLEEALITKELTAEAICGWPPIITPTGYTSEAVIQSVDNYRNWASIYSNEITTRDNAIQSYEDALRDAEVAEKSVEDKIHDIEILNEKIVSAKMAKKLTEDNIARIESIVAAAIIVRDQLQADADRLTGIAAEKELLKNNLGEPPVRPDIIATDSNVAKVIQSVADYHIWISTYASAIKKRDDANQAYIDALAAAQVAIKAVTDKNAEIVSLKKLRRNVVNGQSF